MKNKAFNSIKNKDIHHAPLRLSENILADVLEGSSDIVLFLDIDGTLSEFHHDPQLSVISNENLMILEQLQSFIPIWLVTGRSVTDARRLTKFLKLPVIGSHGLECDNLTNVYSLVDISSEQLTLIKQQVLIATQNNPKWRIEQKPYGVALHFREHPELGYDAKKIMQKIQKKFDNWQLKGGKYVYELLPKNVDKGTAIRHVLEQYYVDNLPIFIGDDVTDEAGFMTVQKYFTQANRQGIGVKVGNESTHANYFVSDVPAVTALLQGLLTLCQN